MYNLYCETLKSVGIGAYDFKKVAERISTAKNGHQSYKLSNWLNAVKDKGTVESKRRWV